MIRTASEADVDSIRTIMKSVHGFWDEAWRTDVLERALISAESLAIVHVDDNTIDGFACAHDLGFRAYLSELVVLPSAHGKGIGGELLGEIERLLKRRGCSLMIADVWQDAFGFYSSRGWAPPPVVLMRKRIT